MLRCATEQRASRLGTENTSVRQSYSDASQQASKQSTISIGRTYPGPSGNQPNALSSIVGRQRLSDETAAAIKNDYQVLKYEKKDITEGEQDNSCIVLHAVGGGGGGSPP